MSADWPEGFAYYPDALTEAERLEALENKTAEFEQRIAALEARAG